MVLLLWLLTIAGFYFWIHQLQKRIENLEHPSTKETFTSGSLNATETTETVEDDGIDRSKWPEHLKTAATKSTPKVVSKTATKGAFDLEHFLGQKLFPILGATSIVIAIGFFAVWAFANGWVGPMGRIALGLMVSLALIGLGEWLKTKYPDFFTYLVAAGLAGLIITTLIAHYAYDFITETQSLVLLALQAAAGVLLSLRYNSRILANFSIAAGLLAPWFTGQLEPMLVLPFVLILAVAGFVLALHKKWPEIFVSLLIFTSSYVFTALGQLTRDKLDYNYNLNLLETASSINPFHLLIFAFVIYALIGSAGLVRLILNYKSTEPPKEESGEIVLFTLSLTLFNLCAAGVFYAQSWEHIGFLVAAQALGLLALAEWFKNKKWPHFQLLTLSSALLFVLLATLWELKSLESLILTLALVIEGILMCAIGQLSAQKTYEWFGRGTILIAFFTSTLLETQDFLLEALLTFTLMAAFLYSAGKAATLPNKIWLGFTLFISTALLFEFSFEAREITEVLKNILPALWTLGILYFAYQQKSFFLRMTSLLVYAFLALITVNQFISNDALFLATWLPIALIGSIYYYVSLSFKETAKTEAVMSYLAVLIASIAWLYQTGDTLSEPLLTVSWLLLIGALMALGISQKPLKELRYVGLGLMLFVIAKLYLVDIWQWDIPIRVMAFSALGVALLSIGFFYQKTWLKK